MGQEQDAAVLPLMTRMRDDTKSLFWGPNIGDLALCVKQNSTEERYGAFISRLNFGATKHVETGMPPLHEHVNQVFGDLSLERSILKMQCRIKPNGGRS